MKKDDNSVITRTIEDGVAIYKSDTLVVSLAG